MIVRRLCVTPAVGSLMQWLLTSRNRTAERTDRNTVRQPQEVESIHSEEHRHVAGQFVRPNVQQKTQHLLQGPLKHVRAAALAAALVPLAAVAVMPAGRTAVLVGRDVCGIVWNDTNNNGIQDPGEPVIENAVVTSLERTRRRPPT